MGFGVVVLAVARGALSRSWFISFSIVRFKNHSLLPFHTCHLSAGSHYTTIGDELNGTKFISLPVKYHALYYSTFL